MKKKKELEDNQEKDPKSKADGTKSTGKGKGLGEENFTLELSGTDDVFALDELSPSGPEQTKKDPPPEPPEQTLKLDLQQDESTAPPATITPKESTDKPETTEAEPAGETLGGGDFTLELSSTDDVFALDGLAPVLEPEQEKEDSTVELSDQSIELGLEEDKPTAPPATINLKESAETEEEKLAAAETEPAAERNLLQKRNLLQRT